MAWSLWIHGFRKAAWTLAMNPRLPGSTNALAHVNHTPRGAIFGGFTLYADSGADITLLPRSACKGLGYSLKTGKLGCV